MHNLKCNLTLRSVLRNLFYKLLNIEKHNIFTKQDHKLKHMADLQQSVVSDPETRAQLAVQMLQWEENLERLHCEQFRLRCYMASLQSGELPNPKVKKTNPS